MDNAGRPDVGATPAGGSPMIADSPAVSVVVPGFGCSDALVEIHERLVRVLEASGRSFEIIFIDDRSHDTGWARLREIAARDDRVVACRLSRNFGQHAALTAGIAEARGHYVVAMDCDLQDPPEEISRLLAAADEGANVVLMRRRASYQGSGRRFAARAYGWCYRTLTGLPRDTALGTFSLITRPVVTAFLSVGDRERQYLPLLHWLGFETRVLQFERISRPVGRSSYTPGRLVANAVSGIVFSTTRVLAWTIYCGLLLAAAGLALAVFYVVRFFVGDVAPGFTSLIVAQLLVGGLLMIAVGVSALYLGKTFEQVRGRPLYVVEERLTRSSTPIDQDRPPPPAPA